MIKQIFSKLIKLLTITPMIFFFNCKNSNNKNINTIHNDQDNFSFNLKNNQNIKNNYEDISMNIFTKNLNECLNKQKIYIKKNTEIINNQQILFKNIDEQIKEIHTKIHKIADLISIHIINEYDSNINLEKKIKLLINSNKEVQNLITSLQKYKPIYEIYFIDLELEKITNEIQLQKIINSNIKEIIENQIKTINKIKFNKNNLESYNSINKFNKDFLNIKDTHVKQKKIGKKIEKRIKNILAIDFDKYIEENINMLVIDCLKQYKNINEENINEENINEENININSSKKIIQNSHEQKNNEENFEVDNIDDFKIENINKKTDQEHNNPVEEYEIEHMQQFCCCKIF